MAKSTTTRSELADAAYARVSRLSRAEAKGLVDLALEEILDVLAQGEAVKLASFGTFSVRSKAARLGRNPRTGQEHAIAARRVVTFKPAPKLVALVNETKKKSGSDERRSESGLDRAPVTTSA